MGRHRLIRSMIVAGAAVAALSAIAVVDDRPADVKMIMKFDDLAPLDTSQIDDLRRTDQRITIALSESLTRATMMIDCEDWGDCDHWSGS